MQVQQETVTKSYASHREFASTLPVMVEAGWSTVSTATLEHGLSHRFLDRFRANKRTRRRRPELKVVVV
jgi:hypothetical protein